VFSMIIIRIGLGLTSPSGETNFGTSMIQTSNGDGGGKNGLAGLGPFLAYPDSRTMHSDTSTTSQGTVGFLGVQVDKDRGELSAWQVFNTDR